MDEHRFNDSYLYKIVLGATLNINPFHKLSAGEIRRLCIENHERLEKIKDLFSSEATTEANEVLGRLKGQAVILIFDGLRVDAWEELVQPVLEEKYDAI